MYVYAALEGSLFRFSTISWIEWLKHLKETGEKTNVHFYAKHISDFEGEMLDWGQDDVEYAMDKIASRKKKTKRAANG